MVHNLPRRDPEKRLWLIAFLLVGALVSAASIYTRYAATKSLADAERKQQQILGGINEIKAVIGSKPDATQTQVLSDAVAELRKHLAKRHIDGAARQKLVDQLRSMGTKSVRVQYVVGAAGVGGDTFDLAKQLESIFVDAGWKLYGPTAAYMRFGPPITDLLFGWKAQYQPWFNELALDINQAGININHNPETDPSVPDENSISIIVGAKS